jgi:hypothetical protein
MAIESDESEMILSVEPVAKR